MAQNPTLPRLYLPDLIDPATIIREERVGISPRANKMAWFRGVEVCSFVSAGSSSD